MEGREGKARSGKRVADQSFAVLKTQLMICGMALLLALMIKFIGRDVYKVIREKYVAMFDDRTSIGEVLQTAVRVFDQGTSPIEDEESDLSQGTVSEEAGSKEDESQSSESAPSGGNSGVGAEDEGPVYTEYNEAAQHIVQTGAGRINTMILPVSGRISDSFGYRNHPLSGSYQMHNGVDIAANHGDNIAASYDGAVEKCGQADDYGKYILIDHGGGLKTLYAHCSRIITSEGQTVKKGQVIGLVGSTGISTGPHCHFEVRVNGVRINPLWLVSERNT